MAYKKVETHPFMFKDESTGCIINTNTDEIEKARQRKEIRKQRKEEEARLKTEVDSLRSELDSLKTMIKELVK